MLFTAIAVIAGCYAEPAPVSSSRNRAAKNSAADEEEEDAPPTKKKKGATTEDHSQHTAETPAPDDGSEPSTGADVFGGAPAYTKGSPPHSANDHHETPMTGMDCLSCHNGDTAPEFLFGGTVYRGTKPAPNVQVRVLDAAGEVQGSTYSDADGNFWVAGTGGLAPGRTGVRHATTAKSMAASISSGGCNASSCHGTNNRINVP